MARACAGADHQVARLASRPRVSLIAVTIRACSSLDAPFYFRSNSGSAGLMVSFIGGRHLDRAGVSVAPASEQRAGTRLVCRSASGPSDGRIR